MAYGSWRDVLQIRSLKRSKVHFLAIMCWPFSGIPSVLLVMMACPATSSNHLYVQPRVGSVRDLIEGLAMSQRGKPQPTINYHGAQPPSAATEESSQGDKISNDSGMEEKVFSSLLR